MSPYDDDLSNLKWRAADGDKDKPLLKKTTAAKRAEKLAWATARAFPRSSRSRQSPPTQAARLQVPHHTPGQGGVLLEACPDPYPNGRAHVCQIRLTPHRASVFPKSPGGGGHGRGKGQGKGARP